MNKLNKVAALFASVALAAPMSSALAQSAESNWRGADGSTVWKNGGTDSCWRSNNWTPETAERNCDGAYVPPPPPPPPAVVVTPPPAPAPAPVAPPAAVKEKLTFAGDALFATGSAVLSKDFQKKLTDLSAQVKTLNLEVIIVTGHTDSQGRAASNQTLSEKRAAAVKTFLVSKGVDANRVYTEGKGATVPVADNSTTAGRAKNRRVEIQIVGTKLEGVAAPAPAPVAAPAPVKKVVKTVKKAVKKK
jgi:OOP family OmpA-OmpF porin